jgi:hypothetical protein
MYDGPDGRRYAAATTFASKAEARAWLALRQADIIRKAWQPPEAVSRPGRLTFGACVEQWMTHRQLKPRTREHYRWLLDEHLIPAFGDAVNTASQNLAPSPPSPARSPRMSRSPAQVTPIAT